jgi:hypothetical protein
MHQVQRASITLEFVLWNLNYFINARNRDARSENFFISPLAKIQKSLLRSRSQDKKKRKDDKASSAFAVIVVDGMRTWNRALIKSRNSRDKKTAEQGIYNRFESAKFI